GATLHTLVRLVFWSCARIHDPGLLPRREHYLPACLVNLWQPLPATCELDHRSKVFGWTALPPRAISLSRPKRSSRVRIRKAGRTTPETSGKGANSDADL